MWLVTVWRTVTGDGAVRAPCGIDDQLWGTGEESIPTRGNTAMFPRESPECWDVKGGGRDARRLQTEMVETQVNKFYD